MEFNHSCTSKITADDQGPENGRADAKMMSRRLKRRMNAMSIGIHIGPSGPRELFVERNGQDMHNKTRKEVSDQECHVNDPGKIPICESYNEEKMMGVLQKEGVDQSFALWSSPSGIP
jgi:hypothetical protein